MSNSLFKRVQHFFQISYLFFMVCLLLIYIFTTPKDFLFNKISFSVIIIIAGFKFDFLDGKYLPIITQRFKSGWLNCINWFVQIWVFYEVVADKKPIYLMSYLGLTNSNHMLTPTGLILSIIIVIFLVTSLIFTITLPKINSIPQAIIVTIEMIFYYISVFSAMFYIIITQIFGKLSDTLDLSLLGIFFIFVPMVYMILHQQGIEKPKWLTVAHGKNLLPMIPFFIIQFCIDSAVWLHPFQSWQPIDFEKIIFSVRSGVGEEFLFRILIMTLFIKVLRRYKNGKIWAVVIQAVLFGSFHLANLISGESVSATLASTIDAFGVGLFFGVVYLLTENIGIVISVHVVWDLMQLIVTGSGNMSVQGIEGFIISTIVMLLFVIYSLFIINKHKKVFEYPSFVLIKTADNSRRSDF